jgi:hypothetical protein
MSELATELAEKHLKEMGLDQEYNEYSIKYRELAKEFKEALFDEEVACDENMKHPNETNRDILAERHDWVNKTRKRFFAHRDAAPALIIKSVRTIDPNDERDRHNDVEDMTKDTRSTEERNQDHFDQWGY